MGTIAICTWLLKRGTYQCEFQRSIGTTAWVVTVVYISTIHDRIFTVGDYPAEDAVYIAGLASMPQAVLISFSSWLSCMFRLFPRPVSVALHTDWISGMLEWT